MREKKFAHEKNISVLIVQKKLGVFCENVKKRSHLYGLAHTLIANTLQDDE